MFFKESILGLLESKYREKKNMEEVFGQNIIFSTLLRLGQDEEHYEEIVDRNKLLKQLNIQLEEYNMSGKNQSKMELVFFEDAIVHICRIV